MQSYRDDFFAWEQRKLKDVLDISKTKNKAQQYGKVDVLSVSREVGTVNQIKYQGRSFAGSDLSNYKVVQGGELIYTKSPLKGAPYGIFQVATIKGIISPLYAVYTSTDKAYTPFVATALKNDNIATHYLTPLVTKGAKNTINVTDEGALEGKIQFPSILEQKQIFIFFKQLDDIIALHEEKKRQLERLKSALLQKMFADKSRYPAVRFEGFSDKWKIFTLSSLATMHARIGWQNLRTSEFLSHGKYMLITGTDFKNGQINFSTCHYVEKERYEQDKHIQIKNGSILITKDGTLGKVAYVQGLSKPATLNAGIFNIEIRNENEIDRIYLFQYLKAPFLMNYVQERATGGTIKHLNQSILKSFPVQVPNKIEQNKIGELITKLDHLINLQRTKLNDIAALKNSLLQSMFI